MQRNSLQKFWRFQNSTTREESKIQNICTTREDTKTPNICTTRENPKTQCRTLQEDKNLRKMREKKPLSRYLFPIGTMQEMWQNWTF
jgi:hypothetical protein